MIEISRDLTNKERLELQCAAKLGVCWFPIICVLVATKPKFGTKGEEKDQRRDLGRQSSNHDVDSHLILAWSVRA